MKAGLSLSYLALVLLSCAYEGIAPSKVFPVREIHYDLKTGDKVGEKTFVYDASGNLIHENSIDLRSKYNFDVFYEYDGEGNLLKERRGNPDQFIITEYTYADGRKLTETQHIEGRHPSVRTEYFYSGSNTADSARRFSYSTIDQEFKYSFSLLYSHDERGRIKAQFLTHHRGGTDLYAGRTEFKYEGTKLVSTCDIYPGYEGEEYSSCSVNGYDRNGQLTTISRSYGELSEVLEEYFYKGGILDEKRMYTYVAYQLPGAPLFYVTQVKYEY